MTVSLRQYIHPQDYAAVLQLWQTAGPGIHVRRSDDPDQIELKLQRDPDLFILAEDDGQVVGTVLGGFDGRRGMMYHLAVRHDHRGQGLGEQLMTALEERLRLKGCIRYYLLVTKDNLDAIHFYEKRGWTCMDDLHAYAKNI
jgi:ribosomal protein S18 acetylase RimI-like enzyme